MALTLRQDIDRRLNISEMDGNFIYLQNLALSGGSSGTFSRDVYSNWYDAMNNGTLPVGQFIEITDRGDAGVLLYCSATNSFALEGTGCFMNADYQGIGNYSTVEGFSDDSNVWGQWIGPTEENAFNGDIFIWSGSHYIVTDRSEFNGSDPSTNTAAYFNLTDPSEGYIFEWDVIIYDFVNDNIKWRIDKRGNKISLWNADFQWGDDKIRSIGMSTYESYITIINNSGYINGSLSGLYASVDIYLNYNTIYFDIDGTQVTLDTDSNRGNIECHIEGFSSGLQCNNNSIYGDIRVYIYDSSYVNANENNATIYASYQGNSIVEHNNNNSDITYTEFVNSYIENINTIALSSCSINGLGTEDSFYDFNTLTGTWSNKCYTPYESTFDYQIDYTYITPLGLSPSDIVWHSLTIPNELSFIGNFSVDLDQSYNIMMVIGNKEELPVKLETTNFTFNIYSVQDSVMDNDCILSTAFNTGSYGGLSPIFATDSYFSFMIYPVQYWSNSGVSSYIELQRKSNNLSINRVTGYGGWSQ